MRRDATAWARAVGTVPPAERSPVQLGPARDGVSDARKRRVRVNIDALRSVLPGQVKLLHQSPLVRRSAELVCRTSIKAPQKCVSVDGQDEDGVEEVDEDRVIA